MCAAAACWGHHDSAAGSSCHRSSQLRLLFCFLSEEEKGASLGSSATGCHRHMTCLSACTHPSSPFSESSWCVLASTYVCVCFLRWQAKKNHALEAAAQLYLHVSATRCLINCCNLRLLEQAPLNPSVLTFSLQVDVVVHLAQTCMSFWVSHLRFNHSTHERTLKWKSPFSATCKI